MSVVSVWKDTVFTFFSLGSWKECLLGCLSSFAVVWVWNVCCHSKWASNVLCFSCRLCHLGLGLCMNDHNPVFCSQFLLTKLFGLSLVCWGRTLLVHSLSGLKDPLLCVICQTALFGCSGFLSVSAGSISNWSVLDILKGLHLVLVFCVEFLLAKVDLSIWVCHVTVVVL